MTVERASGWTSMARSRVVPTFGSSALAFLGLMAYVVAVKLIQRS